ncbi:MAG: DNA-methyltransferase [Chthoniobacterales bacterium]
MDCLEGMRNMEPGAVDVIVTSPPYNLGVAYRSYQDRRTRDDYLSWCEDWAAQVHRVLKDEGSLFLNMDAASGDPTLPMEVMVRLVSKLFRLQNTIHWVKSISLPGDDGTIISRGHFKPINSRRFLNGCHEYVFHLTKSGNVALDRLAVGVPYADKSNVGRWEHTNGNDLRCAGNVWFVPYETIRSRAGERPHPATFPVALAERCIKLHGKARPVVMDPFLGLGATAEAAWNLDAERFVGFEIDSGYANFARRRCDRLAKGAKKPDRF